MRAMLTVAGKDRTGVIAKISNTLFEHNVNIVDVRPEHHGRRSVCHDYAG